jgi:DNA-binding CsgD family transcriptional regulator
MDAAVTEKIRTIGQAHPPQDGAEKRLSKTISPAEKRILNLAIKGMTDKEICRELGLSITTVRTHWTRLRKKLGVVNRAQAVAEALDLQSNEQLRLMQARVKAMHRALNQCGLAVWEWHPQFDKVVADDLSSRMFNSGCGGEQVPLARFLEALPTEDRSAIANLLREMRASSPSDGVVHKVRLPNALQLQVRTRITRVQLQEHPVVFCTTEAVGNS